MTDKRDRELLLQLERQDERLDRVEDDIRAFNNALLLQQKMMVTLEYQSKLIEELKDSIESISDYNKEVYEKNAEQHKSQTTEISNLKTSIALLELKSGWWGVLGGILAFVSLLAIEFISAKWGK